MLSLVLALLIDKFSTQQGRKTAFRQPGITAQAWIVTARRGGTRKAAFRQPGITAARKSGSLLFMTIWTPRGEHEVSREAADTQQQAPPPNQPPNSQPPSPSPTAQDPQVDPQAQREYEQQLAEIRQNILETPIELILAQHFLGLSEIAVIHLSEANPNLESARLVINAMNGIVSATQGELGDAEEALQLALHQVQMEYVKVSQKASQPQESPESPAG